MTEQPAAEEVATDTFGLPACDVIMISKLRNMPLELRNTILKRECK